MSQRLTIILSGAALLAAACAPMAESGDSVSGSAARPERQCFDVSQVRNFRQGTVGTVYFRVSRNDVYRVNSAGGCVDLDFANQLAILPDAAGSVGSRVCTGDQARLVVPGSASPTSVCRVRIEKRLTEEEVAALPSAQRP